MRLAFAAFALVSFAGCLYARARSKDAEDEASDAVSTDPFSDSFAEYPDGLITNEYAHWSPGDARARRNPNWVMTSGSLFAQGGAGWSGVPDDRPTGPDSKSGNDSCVFRLTTRRADFGDVAVFFELLNQGLTSTGRTPKVDWDGVHIFLRYKSQYRLYYASVNRRDNKVVIKKKRPGGPSNGGTYYAISREAPYEVPYGRWQRVRATVADQPDGSVRIELYAGGRLLVSAVDDGKVGGPPIHGTGRTGIRADNADIKLRNFEVHALSPLSDLSTRMRRRMSVNNPP